MNGGIFAGINQGLQNFINTQVAIHQLKRQEKQDALSLEKFRREMMLADYQLRKLEREEEDIKTIQEIGKSLPSTKKVIKIGGKEYTARETEKALDEGIPYEVEERPMTLKERYEQMVEQLEKQGKFTLAAHFREKAEQAGLREVEMQRQTTDAIKNAYDVASQLYRTGNKEKAIEFINSAARKLGIPFAISAVHFDPDKIRIITEEGRHFAVTPDGRYFDVTRKLPDNLYEILSMRFMDPKTGQVDWDKVLREAKKYMIETKNIGDSDKETREAIRQDIKAEQDAIRARMAQIQQELKGISKQKAGLFDVGVNEIYVKRLSPTRKEKITDKKEIEKIDALFAELNELTQRLKDVPREVRSRYGRGEVPQQQSRYKDAKGNPVLYGVPYKVEENGEIKYKVLIKDKDGKDKWVDYSIGRK